MWFKYFAFTVILLASTAAKGDSSADIRRAYDGMAAAARSGDFQSMRAYHDLQEGLTFEILEENWGRVQAMYEDSYPTLDEITLLKTLPGKKAAAIGSSS